MKRNRWTTVCDSRTSKCSYMVSGADKEDNESRYKKTNNKIKCSNITFFIFLLKL